MLHHISMSILLSSLFKYLNIFTIIEEASPTRIINERYTLDVGNSGFSGTPMRYPIGNGAINGHYRPGVSQIPIQSNQPAYGGSQSNANANANANVKVNGGAPMVNPSYYPVSSRPVNGNANANAQANAAANTVGTHTILDKYPGGQIGQLEVIPVRPVPQPIPPMVQSMPHSHSQSIPQRGQAVIPIVIVENSPQTQHRPQHQRPNYPNHYPHRPYGGKRKEQPVEIIIIEESAPNQGDVSRSNVCRRSSILWNALISGLHCKVSALSLYNPSWK